MKKYNVAVVGVGAVGVEMLRCLRQRRFPIDSLKVFARSERDIEVDGTNYHIEALGEARIGPTDIALFAGTEGEKGASKMYSRKFIDERAVVIDNGVDFRMEKDVPLIVPEANKGEVFKHKGLISNPNCTTIQMIVALSGIHSRFGLNRIIVSSFQATSGAGKKAAETVWEETAALVELNKGKGFDCLDKKLGKDFSVFPSQIAFNVIPQIGGFSDQAYTSEEWKVVNETHKIFNDYDIKISATCARVPVFTSHCESIYFETKKDTELKEIKEALQSSKGLVLCEEFSYPLPLDVEGTDDVYVARVRRDPFVKNSFWMWVVADNLRKGAALNAVQIAEELIN